MCPEHRECCLLAHLFILWLIYYLSQDHLPRNGPAHNGLDPLASIIKTISLPDMSTAQSDLDSSSTEVIFQMI